MASTVAEVARRLKPPAAAKGLPRLLVMTDSIRLADPINVLSGVPRGAAIVFRHYDAPERAQLARVLARACRRARVGLIIAGDARLARSIGADGLHLPEAMLKCDRRWQRWRRPRWIVTAAAHTPTAIRRAKASGVDAVLVSPVFPTRSHPDASTLGPHKLARWVWSSPIPVYALGGIDARSARRLQLIKLAGFAGIDGVTAPPRSHA